MHALIDCWPNEHRLNISCSYINPSLRLSAEFPNRLIMAPSSKITIATSSVLRLVKEEASYHKELEQQQARIEKLDSSDENAEYTLKQEVR